MDNLLQQGVAAARAGDKSRAYQLLLRATQDRMQAEHAWLWLSSVVDHDEERLFCLDNVLRLNPQNQPAKRGATLLRQKGVFPASLPSQAPQPPAFSPAEQIASQSSFQNGSFHSDQAGRQDSAQRIQTPTGSGQAQAAEYHTPISAVPEDKSRQEMASWYNFVALALSNHTTPDAIVKQLISRGVAIDMARRIVEETRRAVNQARGQKYRNRMLRGLLFTVIGSAVTCATMAMSGDLGGQYVICYGAIIWGLIDLVAGAIGWLFNR